MQPFDPSAQLYQQPAGGMGGAPLAPQAGGAEQQQLMDAVSKMSPEEQTKFFALLSGDMDAAGMTAREDMSRADAIRTDLPEGRTTRGIYTAANPLEFAAPMMESYRKKRDLDTGKADLAAADSQKQQLISTIMRQMAGQQQR